MYYTKPIKMMTIKTANLLVKIIFKGQKHCILEIPIIYILPRILFKANNTFFFYMLNTLKTYFLKTSQ